MDVANASESAVGILNFNIEGVLRAGSDAVREARYADAVSSNYELVAICELLLGAEVDAFLHHLVRSAQTRRWIQRQADQVGGYPASVLKASRLTGLFGAVIAMQWDLAREIAAASPREADPSTEYEDDFLYADFLHGYLTGRGADEQAAILEAFEDVLEGEPSPRLELCRCLLEPDRDASERAFRDLIDAREAEIVKLTEETATGADVTFQVRSLIHLEGLAWLRLLSRVGIDLLEEFPRCPRMALPESMAPFEPSSFPGVPL